MKHHAIAIGLALWFWLTVACMDLVLHPKPRAVTCNPWLVSTCEP